MLICLLVDERTAAYSPILAGIKSGGGIIKRIVAVEGKPQDESISFELIRKRRRFNVSLEIVEQKIALDENVKMRLMNSVANLLEDVPRPAKTRIVNCLRGARIVGPRPDLPLVADIVLHTEDEFSKMKNMGSKSVDHVISALQSKGLDLAEHLNEDVLAYARSIATSPAERGIK
jgi:Bacterial RNA polymerase, alpha chain C terminal domain